MVTPVCPPRAGPPSTSARRIAGVPSPYPHETEVCRPMSRRGCPALPRILGARVAPRHSCAIFTRQKSADQVALGRKGVPLLDRLSDERPGRPRIALGVLFDLLDRSRQV